MPESYVCMQHGFEVTREFSEQGESVTDVRLPMLDVLGPEWEFCIPEYQATMEPEDYEFLIDELYRAWYTRKYKEVAES